MDLRAYYKRVRDAEASIAGEHVVVVSFDTSEGGKEGVRTEVARQTAARLIAEGSARVATEKEATEFRERIRADREKCERDEAARRIQVMVIPSHEALVSPAASEKERS